MEWIGLAVGILAGGVVAWMLASARGRAAAAAAEARATEMRRAFETAEQRLKDTFQALAADALKANTDGFLSLAHERLGAIQKEAEGHLAVRTEEIKGVLEPVRQTLGKVQDSLKTLEGHRQEAYSNLTREVQKLQSETGNLVTALRKPDVRGRWGEIQLKRVVEIAGMLDHCDFIEQETAEAGRLRPDLVVKLPGGKNIVVDSKVPLIAYLEALERPAGDERTAKLKEHAQQVRTHMFSLSSKSYFARFSPAPDFVVLFLPGEAFFSAALEHDPTLLEEGTGRNVILAAPTTLIALLKAVYYGWKQEVIVENARKISDLGRELHDRAATMSEHFLKLGSSLEGAVDAFNKTIGSFESNVLRSARKLADLGMAGQKEVREILKIEERPRSVGPASGV
ncbi:MAG TPA: DNA recombination protein RmuC [Planctomycetota bacterium]|nr:DNA recombination protein RmuC [Planctomycetota bacterium]